MQEVEGFHIVPLAPYTLRFSSAPMVAVLRLVLLWVLASVGAAASLHAQAACDRAYAVARDANRRLDAPERLERLARAARLCFLAAGAPVKAAPAFALEAWALGAQARWEEVAAVGAGFQDTGVPFAEAPTAFAVATRETAIALVMLGRASEGLALLDALDPHLVRFNSPRLSVEHRRARAHLLAHLGAFDEAAAEAEAAVRLSEQVGAADRADVALGARLQRVQVTLARHEDGDAQPIEVLHATRREAERIDSSALVRGQSDLRPLAALAAVQAALALHDLPAATQRLERMRVPSTQAGLQARLRGDVARLDHRSGEALIHYERAVRLAASPAARVDAMRRRGEALLDARTFAAAFDAFRAALDTLDAERARTGTDDAALLRRGAEQQAVHGAVRSLVALGRTSEAFAFADGYRARLLSLYRLRTSAGPGTALHATLQAIAAVRDTLGRPEGDVRRVRLMVRLQRLHARLATLQRLPAPVPVDVPTLQSRLRAERRVLVAYLLGSALGQPTRPAASLAFVVTPDTVRAVALDASAPSLRATLARALPLIVRDGAITDRAAFDLHALHGLYQTLVAPLALPPGPALTVVPDGPLFALPFGALVTHATSRFDPAGARFLVEERPLAVELAASLLLAPPGPLANDSLVVFARSDFARARLPNLPSVAAEARWLRRWPRAAVWLDEQAVEARFAEAAPHARFVHLAAHTDVSARSPLDYSIRLWPEGRSNGRLALHELLGTPLRADLVVLSGCNTARGTGLAGEGMLGLQYAVRAAGARSTVATLWVADDASTAALTRSFYEHVRKGLPRDAALREAQLAHLTRASGAARSPYFWAAPVLYGDASPLAVAPAPVRFRGIAAGAVALGGLVFLAFRLTRRRRLDV